MWHVSQLLGKHALTPAERKRLHEAMEAGSAPFLAYRDENGTLSFMRLVEEDTRVVIGRSFQSDLALTWDAGVSRVHAEVSCVCGEWFVEDDGLSRFGTFVHGVRVLKRHRLRNDEAVRVGTTDIVFVDPQRLGGSLLDATSPPLDHVPGLSSRDRLVLQALARPCLAETCATPATNREIGEALCLSEARIKELLREIAKLLGVSGAGRLAVRRELVVEAIRRGLVSH
jgi:DNA-binding CsgD family transcriptional regulator